MDGRFALPDEKLRPSSAGLGNVHSEMEHSTWLWTTQARMGSEDQSSKTFGSYRDCPGDERGGYSPVICPGAVSIGSFELCTRRMRRMR